LKAVILLNMGGPNNLEEVPLFLTNMFNDKNIITTKSALLRKMIAFLITTSRKKEAINNYKLLGGKSPIVEKTQKLVKKLQEHNKDIFVSYAMRYTPPFSKEVIEVLKKKGVKEVLLVPLYPHYSTTTVKSSLEEFFDTAKKLNFNADIKYIEHFYDNDLYNQAILEQIIKTMEDKDTKEYDLIFSAHSLPQKIVDNGDPYNEQVKENVRILKELLKNRGVFFNDISIAYQSKLGPVKWLEPSLEEQLKTLKSKKVVIYPISFIIDNSETLYELHIEYKKIAKNIGFLEYIVCECLNDNPLFIDFLNLKIGKYLSNH